MGERKARSDPLHPYWIVLTMNENVKNIFEYYRFVRIFGLHLSENPRRGG